MIEEIRLFIRSEAERFGAKYSTDIDKVYVERNNTGPQSLNDDGAYFGFIHPEEENTGPFHDFSLTIFPSAESKPWLVCLGIGSSGFKNDYELASFPGIKRLFSKLINDDGYCKSNFADIESNLPSSFTNKDEIQHIKRTIKQYSKFLPVVQILSAPNSLEGKKVISSFVAAYAKIRGCASNKSHRDAITEALKPFLGESSKDNEGEVLALIKERKYVVLQGPPGTGKTRLAKRLGDALNAQVFFTQFHAETSYTDFIYGIKPNLKGSELSYVDSPGVLVNAINYALLHDTENVLLVIDEINRANLSNVLGQLFYLFEYNQEVNTVEISLSPNCTISNMPKNLFVIATMNTADRSLAVVDFALRRRFAWYDLKPITINSEDFFDQDFMAFKEIFDWYANSDELSLQPGQGYFIAPDEIAMKNRITYELYPLVQEYLKEGLLLSGKEEFNRYFLQRINKPLFQ